MSKLRMVVLLSHRCRAVFPLLLGVFACGHDYSELHLYSGEAQDGGSDAPARGGAPGLAGGGGVATDSGGNSAGGTGGVGGSPPSCDGLYGAAPEYLLCTETTTSCQFLRNSTPARSCDTVCSTYGGTCIDADNGDPGSCAVSGNADCTTSLSSSLCTCSKP